MCNIKPEWDKSFDEVQIVDDAIEESSIIKDIIKRKDEEDAFFTLDVGELIQRHKTWVTKMPRVEPFYAIKCNPHPTVVKAMAALKTGFDCASKYEIQMALGYGVSGDRIIFSQTVKPNSEITLAKTVGVEMMTADGEPELHKIKKFFPEAKIVIRFRCDAGSSLIKFGAKSGCDAATDGMELIRIAKDLGLNIYGFNFNVGTQCLETEVYARGMKIAVGLIEYAKSIGHKNVELINLGGGFPSGDRLAIDKFADVINEALEDVDPSIKVISEPGRYYVGTAFTLTTFVTGKKTVDEGDRTRYIYYTNDGIFGSFFNSALNLKDSLPIPLIKSAKEVLQPTTIFGPTSVARDCVVSDSLLPEFNIGDWLLWPNTGAYSLSRWRVGDRIHIPVVYSFIKRKLWMIQDNKSIFPGLGLYGNPKLSLLYQKYEGLIVCELQ